VPRSYKEDNWDKQVSSVWESVKKRDTWKRVGKEPLRRKNLSTEAKKISTVRSRYQGTAGEDTAGWKRFRECCGDL
jgi:hypothetical protein